MDHLFHFISGTGTCVRCGEISGADFLIALVIPGLLFCTRYLLRRTKTKVPKLSSLN